MYDKSSELWVASFEKTAKEMGITDPKQVEALLFFAQSPDKYAEGYDEVMAKSAQGVSFMKDPKGWYTHNRAMSAEREKQRFATSNQALEKMKAKTQAINKPPVAAPAAPAPAAPAAPAAVAPVKGPKWGSPEWQMAQTPEQYKLFKERILDTAKAREQAKSYKSPANWYRNTVNQSLN